MGDNWHRIERVIKWTGLSVNAFSRVIGLNRSENLYQIKRGNNGISRELADVICAKYTNISKGWLLSGEGEMFIIDDAINTTKVPYFNRDIVGLVVADEWGDRDSNLVMPTAMAGDFAANFIGDSMKPAISSGAVVICRKVKLEQVVYGSIYLIVSDNFIALRYLRSDDDKRYIKAVASNSADYDTIRLIKGSIKVVYHIVSQFIKL